MHNGEESIGVWGRRGVGAGQGRRGLHERCMERGGFRGDYARPGEALGGGRCSAGEATAADGARWAKRSTADGTRWVRLAGDARRRTALEGEALGGGRRSAGEARGRGEARRVRSQDARADKIGKVEGMVEGMTVSVFVSKYAQCAGVDARRQAGRKQMSHENNVHSSSLFSCIVYIGDFYTCILLIFTPIVSHSTVWLFCRKLHTCFQESARARLLISSESKYIYCFLLTQ